MTITLPENAGNLTITSEGLLFSDGDLTIYGNLLNRGFTFTNPKASGSCGCGTSFQV